MSRTAVVAGVFDNLRSQDIRFLHEASKTGPVLVCLWSDDAIIRSSGTPPKFPQGERKYLLEAIRFVSRVQIVTGDIREETIGAAVAGSLALADAVWVVPEWDHAPAKQDFCSANGFGYQVLGRTQLAGFPSSPSADSNSIRKKVIVTGCYDWLHSGHVRFFEEVRAYVDLYVVVGHDANIRLLKGAGHPLLPQDERRYLVGSIRHVKQALISSGDGWLDAQPEMAMIKPAIYAVNEDGDKGGKRELCEQHGI